MVSSGFGSASASTRSCANTGHVFTLGEEIRDRELFKDEVHLKPEGLRLEAQAVARYIVEHRLLHKPRSR